MTKNKRLNPAYAPGIDSKAWVIAGECHRKKLSYYEMAALITATSKAEAGPLTHNADIYRRDFSYNQINVNDKLRRRILERLPIRRSLNDVPFYLRPSYTLFDGEHLGKSFIPDKDYGALTRLRPVYQPITAMKAKLHSKRYDWVRQSSEGLIRWPETINSGASEFVVTKGFNQFYFKINAATEGNKLPVVKKYNSLVVTIHAPIEFFRRTFWGLGDHLVVRDLDTYTLEDGTKVLKTLSCDRENLYALGEPTILKERFYVEKDGQRGTGLTEQAAVRSMQYYMGKSIFAALGV